MGGFGEAVYKDDNATAVPGQETANSGADAVDENDPRLTSEDLEVNVGGDSFAMPAPPPEGIKLRLKLKHLKVKNAAGVEVDYLQKSHETQGPYLATGVEATIVDASGKYDGMKVFDRWVGTFRSRDGSNKISTILARLRQGNGQPWINDKVYPKSHKAWMEMFLKALAGEPEIFFEPQWEWSCPKCGEETKKAKNAGQDVDYEKSVVGMRKFDVDQEASRREKRIVHHPEMQCKVNPTHGWSRIQVRIGQVFPISAGAGAVGGSATPPAQAGQPAQGT